MPRWRSIWLVARREILERGRSRGFILSVAVHDAHRGRLVRRPGARCSVATTPTKVGVVEPAPAGLQAAIEQTRAAVRPQGRDHDLPRRGGRRRGAQRRRASRSSSTCRPTCPAPGEIRVKGQPDQATPRSSPRRPSRLRVQAVLGGSNVDQAALADAQRPPATRRSSRRPSGPGEVPGRQHRGGADPRRHLQLRLHGPDRRRRGEAEPGRRGRAVDRPRPRPADGQGPRDRRPGHRPAGVFVTAALGRRARHGPARRCPRRRRARSRCWRSGSSSATCCTRPRSGSSARSRRGWRRRRTPRPR